MALPEFPLARPYASENYNVRPPDAGIRAIVLHATVGEADSSLAWLTNPISYVACHYLINRDGTIFQLVSESQRALHAGPSFYNGLSDWNNFSVGIEMVDRNDGVDPYMPALVDACRWLCVYLVGKYAVRPDMIVTHKMISGAITGKSDPKGFPLKEFIMSIAKQVPTELRYAAWKALGIDFNPNAMFTQRAQAWGLGRPVTTEQRVDIKGVRWAFQGFESCVLACVEGDWQNVYKVDWFQT